MTLDAGNTDKLAMYTSEAKKSGIAILPPCVNASEVDFLAEAPSEGQQHGAIRYSLAALKNIGAQAVESMVAERSANGAFKDLSDFAAPAQHQGAQQARAGDAGRRRRLRRAGGQPRAGARQRRADAGLRQPAGRQRGAGHGRSLRRAAARRGRPQIDMRPLKAWPPMERLQHEFEAVGFFLSGHPLDAYAERAGQARHLDLRRARGRAPSAARSPGASPASSSRPASAARRRATSSPSPCSPSRPASSRP